MTQTLDMVASGVGEWCNRNCPGSLLLKSSLTTIQLGTPSNPTSSWDTAVYELVRTMLACGHPMMYVQCGGQANGYATGAVMRDLLASELLQVFIDDDVTVYSPPFPPRPTAERVPDEQRTASGGLYYDCNLPTLTAIKSPLSTHEASHGQTCVLLDSADYMRPYHDYGLITAPLDLTAEQRHAWQATDLLAFAESRIPPTVAVWDTEADTGALEALLTISTCHLIMTSFSADEVHVIIRSRTELTQHWSAPTGFRAPAVRLPDELTISRESADS